MFFSSLVAVLAAASASQGLVLPRGGPNCVTIDSGYLSADVEGKRFFTPYVFDAL